MPSSQGRQRGVTSASSAKNFCLVTVRSDARLPAGPLFAHGNQRQSGAMGMSAPIHLRLLGPFSASRGGDGPQEIRFSTRKASALLAFLAMSRQQTATREQLAALLWGNSSDNRARQSLRQTLLVLRKDLHPANIIDAETDTIRLQPGSVSVDALDFEALAGSENLEDLERAVDLLQGEFLAGVSTQEEAFEDWLRQQRQRFELAAARALESYARQCELVGRVPKRLPVRSNCWPSTRCVRIGSAWP